MKKIMNKTFGKSIIIMLLITFIIGLIPNASAPIYASINLAPHVLTTATESDLKKASHYSFTSDGTQLFPLTIPEDGCMVIDMSVRNAGYINIGLHSLADGSDIPSFIACQCTADRGNFGTFTQYIKKGKYYLRFPANSYSLDIVLYSSNPKTITNGSTTAAYCNYSTTDTFTYKSSANGYITLIQKRLINTGASYSVSLCNSKGIKLSDVICDHDIDSDVIFPVKKGTTYKIKIKTLNVDGQQFYQLKLNFASRSKNSGISKSKASNVKINKKYSGIIYAEDNKANTDWYKFTNSKSQALMLSYNGYVSSGSIDFTIYNSHGKSLGSYHLMAGTSATSDCRIYNYNGKKTIPKGIYYIRANKSSKQVAGIYSFKIQKK